MPFHKIIKRKTPNLLNKSPKKKNTSSLGCAEGHVTISRKNQLSTDARFSFDVFVARSSIWGNEIRENVWGVWGKWCLGCDGGSCPASSQLQKPKTHFDLKSCDRISNRVKVLWGLVTKGCMNVVMEHISGFHQNREHLKLDHENHLI